jgi:hypothetical protein
MEHVRTGPAGCIHLTWEPESRLAVLIYESPVSTKGQPIRPLIEALRAWVGADRRTFYLLNDCGPLLYLDAEWRAVWWEFFRDHRSDSWIALYNLGSLMKVVAEMYRVASGLRMEVLGTESDARVWLRQKGAHL